jgi:beta-galactosidase/beta-glucuronidase
VVRESVHPRPQLARADRVDLTGTWDFAYDDDDQGLGAGWHAGEAPFDRTIVVPFPPESKLSGVHDPSYHPVVWYRRRVAAPAAGAGERLLLHFGAVDYRATVWVNGVVVGEHEGGHTPFTCDITDAVAADPTQAVIVVRAEDQPTDVAQPRGKQDWRPEPHGIWYHRTTGIWQPVWLEHAPATHVVEVQWTPDVAAARVRLELALNRAPVAPSTLGVVLRGEDQVLAEQSVRVTEQRTTVDVVLPFLHNGREWRRWLWTPASPTLVDADISVREQGADGAGSVDRVRSYLGLRTVGVRDGAFLLNGLNVYVRGVLAQGYWPESHLAAPDDDALRREVELVKRLGFNAVRVHQKVEDPRFLYWCDRLGLMVWGEMANAFAFDARAVDRLTREWLEVLRRDRSHPCIVTWVPMNESWGIDHIATDTAQRSYATALYHLTKAIDPTRPVLSNDGWEHTESDIWSVHDYSARGSRLRERYGEQPAVEAVLREGRPARRRVVLDPGKDEGQPVMLTEFGGVRFDPGGDSQGWGYSSAGSAQEFSDSLAELFGAVLDSRVLAGFCYTQLTDTEQEQNGLLTAAREPKIPIDRIRRIVRGKPGAAGARAPRDRKV